MQQTYAASADPAAGLARIPEPLRSVWLQNRILVAGVLGYLSIRLLLWTVTGAATLSFSGDSLVTRTTILVIGLWSAVLLVGYAARCLFDRSSGGLLYRRTWQHFHRTYTAPARLLDSTLVILLYLIATNTFVALKGTISSSLPFRYDRAFAAADRMLHGGHDPWTLLQPLLGSPAITRIIWMNHTYLFFLGMGGLVTWLAWTRRKELRGQVLLTMLLMWALLGNGLAAALPAAGPVFFQNVTGDADFQVLVEYLQHVNEVAGLPPVEVQRELWAAHARGISLHGGISAMPSMHVAMATLFALVGWRSGRRAGMVATLFALAIFVGSVHLGWHYAVDGYVAAPLTVLLWWVAGKAQSLDRPELLRAC